MAIKKGDQVVVRSGRDAGKSGVVLKVLPQLDRAVVEGLNMYKRHAKARKAGEKGQMISVSRSLPLSRLMLSCKNCKKATRVGSRVEGQSKVRYCKKCQAAI